MHIHYSRTIFTVTIELGWFEGNIIHEVFCNVVLCNMNGNADSDLDDSGISFFENEGRLSCIGQRSCDNIVEEFATQTRILDLAQNNISNLEHFLQKFPKLETLIIDNNNLSDGFTIPLLIHVHTLFLNKNKLRKLEPLLVMLKEKCPALRYLSLIGNPLCPDHIYKNESTGSDSDICDGDYKRYRYRVLYHLPGLTNLDWLQVSEEERAEARRRGEFARGVIIDPGAGHFDEVGEEAAEANGAVADGHLPNGPSSQYNPLPVVDPAKVTDSAPKTTYGRSQYTYFGKHSEGNRFIRNDDL